MAEKPTMEKSSVTKRDFDYRLNGVTLAFTLRIDNSSELRSFKTCMEQAIVDLDEIIKTLKN